MARGRKKPKVSEIIEIDISNIQEDTSEFYLNNDAVDPFLEISQQNVHVPAPETIRKNNLFHFLHTTDDLNEPCTSSGAPTNTFEHRAFKKKPENRENKKLIRMQKQNAKKNRETGKCYLGYRQVGNTVKQDVLRPARIQRITCTSKLCRKSALKHCNLFTQTERSRIFEYFWKMNWVQKKMYVCNLVNVTATKTSTSETSRRSHSRQYFLINSNNQEYRVCQKMFFNTLAINEKMVRLWLESRLEFGFFEHPDDVREKIMKKRREGEKYKENERRKTYLRDFLKEFPKLESHYCRKDTEKEYLQTEHRTLTAVYKDYTQFCQQDNIKKLSITVFSKMFKKLNYSLFKPRKDQCDDCIAFKHGNLSEVEFRTHRKEIDTSRKEKEKDILDALKNLCTLLCMDVQAVQLCPKLNASALYFKLKMQIHNFTIYDILTHKSLNYVWDETEGELKASIFTSIIVYHLENLVRKKLCCDTVIIYSDGCGYQNRNAILSSALSNFARKHQITIVQKFLVKGHTQMECDSSHALIERATREKTINLPSDFVESIPGARTNPFPLDVKSLTHSFFLNYDDPDVMNYDTIRPGNSVGDPCVTDLRALKYTTDGKIFFKLSFNEEFKILPQSPKNVNMDYRPQQLYQSRIPLSSKKFKHLQELKYVLPKAAQTYYDCLPHEPKNEITKINCKKAPNK